MSRTDGIALAALVLAVVVFFAPALFGDRAVFTWNLDVWHPWAADASPDDRARPGRLADCARQFYVMRHLATDALREGRIPLWNPWIYCGTPFLGNFQPAVFYPPNLILAYSGLPVADQMTAYLAFHLLVAVAGVYVLLRSCGTGPVPALIGAVVFGASGYNAARTGIPTMVATGAWLPWALAASRRWFRRGDGPAFAGMTGALAMSGLAGFAQIFVFTGYAFGLWGLIDGLGRPARGRVRRWLGWGTAGALGVALVAVHLVPTLEFIALGQDARNTAEMLDSGTLHPWVLGKLVVPDLLGHPAEGTNATHLLHVGSGYYHQTERSTSVYVGLLPLLLAAPVLLAPGDRRRASAAALLLAGVGLALSLPGPIGRMLTALPALGFSRPDRATFLFCLAIAILAGLGAQRLAGREGPGLIRGANRLGVLLGAVAIGFAALILAAGGRLLPASVASIVGASLPAAALGALGIALAATVLVASRSSGRLPAGWFLALALGLVVADLVPFASRLNVMQPKERVFPAPAPGSTLHWLGERRAEDGPFRVFRWEPRRSQFAGALPPSTGAVYGVEDALGFDSINLARIADVMNAIDPSIVVRRGNFRGPASPDALGSPLLDLLDVRYVLGLPTLADAVDGPSAAGVPPGRLVRRDDLAAWRRPGRGRAFLVDDVQVRSDPAVILREMSSPGFRADLRAYSEVPMEDLEGGPGGPKPPGSASVAEHRAERVVVEVEPERTALLVLGDAWYPGWKASVDGAERPIHRVDHAFRGVVVRPGDREVVFTYRPASFSLGAGLSLLALALAVAVTFVLHRTRTRIEGAS